MTQRLALLTLCCALGACGPRIDTGPDGGARGPIYAGPAGGLFIRECGALDIPPGALTAEVTIHMAPVASGIPQAAGRTVIGPACRISSSTPDLSFEQDVTVSVPYREELLPAPGIDPADFRLYAQLGVEPPGALDAPSANTTLKVVSAATRRLGLFWVSSPDDPVVGEFTVEPAEVGLPVGGTVQLSARLTNLSGQPLEGVEVRWRVVPARVGRVDAGGLFTATAPGNATVEARASTLVRTVKVYVAGTTRGPTRFVHDTPFPTGNDLLGGRVGGGGELLVAGTNGTVLYRSPGAQGTWSRLASAPLLTLRDVALAGRGAVAVGTRGTAGVLVSASLDAPVPAVQVFDTAAPRAVWYDGTHGMAVGDGNDVLLLEGGAWRTEYSPSFETLLDVVGDGQGGFVTVGAQGSLYVFDPATRTWDSLYQAQLAVLLTDAVVTDATGRTAWAVGGNRLWHFSLSRVQEPAPEPWTAINLPPTPALEALTALGVLDDGRVLVGGVGGGRGHLLTFTPSAGAPTSGTWTQHPPLRGPQVIRAVFGTATDAWAVGDYGALWHSTGGPFQDESRGFFGDVWDVSAAADGTVVAAVNDCVDAACLQLVGQVWRRTGPGQWEPIPGLPAGRAVLSVLARSASDIYVGTTSGVLRFDQGLWSIPGDAAESALIHDFAVCGGEVWAVGARGAVLVGPDKLSLVQPSTSKDLLAVSCTGASNVWAAGSGVLLENLAPRTTRGVEHAAWRAVYTPAPEEAFAFGDDRYGVYWDTERLQVLENFGGLVPRALLGAWGSSIDNLYAVGYLTSPFTHGLALRFDGASWRLIDAGASRPVSAVTGTSDTQLWLGTQGGGVLRACPPDAAAPCPP